MKRHRPYIPLAVRVQVAERQLVETGKQRGRFVQYFPLAARLRSDLEDLFGDEKVALDHEPALINRPFNPKTGKYTPDANDPEHLIYRTVEDHRTKTFVRGDRGQLSDTILRAKNKRMAENRGERPRKKKSKIPQRKNPWPKGRSFSRGKS